MSRFHSLRAGLLVAAACSAWAQVPTTMRDFHVPGTQVGDVDAQTFFQPNYCRACHGDFDTPNEPFATWKGSLMSNAGRDPLFEAQLATANADASYAGYYCQRCHVPMSIPTGHALQTDGSTIDEVDRRGVDCHFCHSMVDPVFRPGQSPPADEDILAALADRPRAYGNSMFVLDPSGTRRGPYDDAVPPHQFYPSPFHRSANLCGTCHDVGNVAVSRQPDGRFRYNALDQADPTGDPWAQFPLERTFTEWSLSAFARGGVDMGGRFGGAGSPVMETCQDCHMPKAQAQGCFFGPTRDDLHRHDFAGAAASVLDLVGHVYAEDAEVDLEALAAGRAKSVSMLERAASLELDQLGAAVRVRVINETGHKLPTGHIEGRRVWVNAKFLDAGGGVLREHGQYDPVEARLSETTTRVYEMQVGLSREAAQVTGLPAGRTSHMALADTIWKDNRIPPRGFENEAFDAGGSPVVAYAYDDGQYWDDLLLAIPPGAARIDVTLYYQNLPRDYIEHLRDANHTNSAGQVLYDAWDATGRGAPIPMVAQTLELLAAPPRTPGDMNCDGVVDSGDVDGFVQALLNADAYRAAHLGCELLNGDVNDDGIVDNNDIDGFVDMLL